MKITCLQMILALMGRLVGWRGLWEGCMGMREVPTCLTSTTAYERFGRRKNLLDNRNYLITGEVSIFTSGCNSNQLVHVSAKFISENLMILSPRKSSLPMGSRLRTWALKIDSTSSSGVTLNVKISLYIGWSVFLANRVDLVPSWLESGINSIWR